MNALELKNIEYTYSRNTPFENKVLDGISVSFEAGKVNGLIGHTGSGKSTLVQMMNGLLKPDAGEVLLFGKNIWEDPKKINDIRFRVGLVFQYPEYQLFEETCEKDIAFGPKNMGLDDGEIKRRVETSADFVGLDRDLLQKSPFELSGGQKRRVALAGIMAMEPDVLILDEPAAGLDPIGRTEIFGGIRRYQRTKGNTVIIVSHSMEDVAEYCDTLSVLRKGELLLSGECGSVFAHEKELTETGLGVPQITGFMRLLREGGMPVRDDIYTIDAAYREIMKMLGYKN
ncbi:MAG: energy-coupling factor transporter ATPase [Ruminococcaceae bacterium]|nr:energy-coupling factor transporter ATPase [Oscillospiraceae bacterium]MBQ9692412.1 energy-coupling factor transporter ATPase [Clostridia bacterium]